MKVYLNESFLNFFNCFNFLSGHTWVRPLTFEGKFVEIYLEAEIRSRQNLPFTRPSDFIKNSTFINGLTEYDVAIRKNIPLSESKIFKTQQTIHGNTTQLDFVNLRPGSVVVVRVTPHNDVSARLRQLYDTIQ